MAAQPQDDMQAESQHLDFLISQYVDGSLEGANKKSVEQKMLTDPEARKLYTQHREVQDILDDYGSRIPMVNWDEFDRKLDARLEVEAQEKQRVSRFRRRMKPLAAAAALLLAVSLGYGWHAFAHEGGQGTQMPVAVVETPKTQTVVSFPEAERQPVASHIGFDVVESGLMKSAGTVEDIAYGIPAEQVALQALEANLTYGYGSLPGSVLPAGPAPGSVVGVSLTTQPRDDGDIIQIH